MPQWARWMAPELLEDDRPTTRSDIYSFGMTLLEVLTGELPFSNLKSNYQVIIAVNHGKRPDLPTPLPPLLSRYIDLIKLCWRDDKDARPDIQQVMAQLDWIDKNQLRTPGSPNFLNPVSIRWP